MNTVEQWQRYELTLSGPTDGNPFMDVQLKATFSLNGRQVTVHGFYDGNGQYKVRYMPSMTGHWQVVTHANVSELDGQMATFNCVAATGENHGPVIVAGKSHFAYADGTAYLPFGTTAYAWTVQSKAVRAQTLATLKDNTFNKIRMTVFPKSYSYNTTEPAMYPYVGAPKHHSDVFTDDLWRVKPEDIGFDFSRFNPEYFQSLEDNIEKLDQLGIQADLILFHPYDCWGFARMGKRFNHLYLRYLIARLASYKNIWWSLANEYDLMASTGQIQLDEWDDLGQFVHMEDPSQHLESIHNFYDPPVHKATTANWYDYSKPWITHLSIQSDNVFFTAQWLQEYQKPVVFDECRYEGNIEFGFGDNTAHGMLDSFWRIMLRGGYATHGETYIDKPNTKRPIWWAHGGQLYGDSPKRIAFLRKLLADNHFDYIKPQGLRAPSWELAAGSNAEETKFLIYIGDNQPEFEILNFLPTAADFDMTVIDTWNMTTTVYPKVINAQTCFQLERKPYQALLLTKKM